MSPFFRSKVRTLWPALGLCPRPPKGGPSPLFMFRNQLAENEPLIDLFKTKRKNQVGGPEMKSRSTRRQIAWQIVNNAAKLISGIVFLASFSFSFSQNCLSATERDGWPRNKFRKHTSTIHWNDGIFPLNEVNGFKCASRPVRRHLRRY